MISRVSIIRRMTKPIDTTTIANTTGITWEDWLDYFKQQDAETLDHAAIARLAHDRMDPQTESRGWWAQSVAVAYEQAIGRRQPGQRADGTYEVSISKTLPEDMTHVMQRWQVHSADSTAFNGVKLKDTPETSTTPKWFHWRAKLANGSRIEVSVTEKSDDKSVLTVTSQKLADAAAVENWRAFWKDYLTRVS